MPLKVLVVDDSQFFQRRLKDIINEHPQLEVIGVANNGREAIDKSDALKPDLITMDYEMPLLDGITAVREIMARRPVPIFMFSSLTYEGAKVTLDALDAGAVDFMSKNFAEVSKGTDRLKKALHNRLLTIARQWHKPKTPSLTSTSNQKTAVKLNDNAADSVSVSKSRNRQAKGTLKSKIDLVIIGASTGGPVALLEVLKKLPKNFSHPILLVQHMPENFTRAFAERLDKQCNIRVREAVDGDKLEPGLALLAPGGKQMMIDSRGRSSVKVLEGDDRITYRPSVDITFGSAANIFGKRVLAVVLTGMGADGCEGARLLKQQGAKIWAQDEESSVIYGMPAAVANANLTDEILSLPDVGVRIAEEG